MNTVRNDIRNVAIIAHVDHGKTTLVDALLRQSGNFRDNQVQDTMLDSNPLERERGITILAKNVAINYLDPETQETIKINLIDTPGHADFGGEVERVLSMADGCFLLVDAAEGPMPQTRFVLKKAFQHELRPIVIINKIDRPDARANEVLNEVFDLFVELGADDEALDFPVLYASGRAGIATWKLEQPGNDITPVFEALLKHVRAPLMKELESNVALKVEETENKDAFKVSGRGLLHLGILIENMRREGYELSISKPHVIMRRNEDGQLLEPIEYLVVDVPEKNMGGVMELVGNRKGELVRMDNRQGQVHLEFTIPARGLIGLRTRMLTATQGEAIMHHNFHEYAAARGNMPGRANGVMVSMTAGNVNAFALNNLQERGVMFVEPGEPVYEGQVVAENARDNDMTVNPTTAKKLTNMRTTSSDENIILKPARKMTLEQALEYIEEDELVEATPKTIRLRKELLTENARKKAGRGKAAEVVEV